MNHGSQSANMCSVKNYLHHYLGHFYLFHSQKSTGYFFSPVRFPVLIWLLLLFCFFSNDTIFGENNLRLYICVYMGFPGGSVVMKPPASTRYVGSIPGWGRSLEVGNGNTLEYSCWEIPWTEEPGGLQSLELQRVIHNWVTEHVPICVYINVCMYQCAFFLSIHKHVSYIISHFFLWSSAIKIHHILIRTPILLGY